ncbi:hypothetical protein, partial [Psychroserpens damuponensis]|uniref:hypothetical protein n=1 Tax=Psychroserpens damuponensis TaxID=943936 RepID=UPI00058C9119
MKKTTYLFVLLFMVAQISLAQDIYKRVTINNIDATVVEILDNHGIDMTCGALFLDDTLQLELSDNELQTLANQGVGY